MESLIYYLSHIPLGEVAITDALEKLLEECWEELDGSSEHNMKGFKLLGRMEKVGWAPPALVFCLERHIASSSTEVLLEHWRIDVVQRTAEIVKSEPRKLCRLSLALSPEEAAEAISQAILCGHDSEHVERNEDGTVTVYASWEFPKESAFRLTLGYRRKKLRRYLRETLRSHGWEEAGRNRFRKTSAGPSHSVSQHFQVAAANAAELTREP